MLAKVSPQCRPTSWLALSLPFTCKGWCKTSPTHHLIPLIQPTPSSPTWVIPRPSTRRYRPHPQTRACQNHWYQSQSVDPALPLPFPRTPVKTFALPSTPSSICLTKSCGPAWQGMSSSLMKCWKEVLISVAFPTPCYHQVASLHIKSSDAFSRHSHYAYVEIYRECPTSGENPNASQRLQDNGMSV